MGSKFLGWILHRLSHDDHLNDVMNEHLITLGYDVRCKSLQDDKLLSVLAVCFVICLSLYWEVRFAILEPQVVALSFLYHSFNLLLMPPSAISKNGFVLKN